MASFDYLQIRFVTPNVYSINGISNISSATKNPIVNGVPTLSGTKVQKISFTTEASTNFTPYKYDNLVFAEFNATDFTTLEITPVQRGKVSIRDTDFPPPGLMPLIANVNDLSGNFLIKEVNITRVGADFSIEIILQSTDGNQYFSATPECRFQEITLATGVNIPALILYPKLFSGGLVEPSFRIEAVNLSGINSMGMPIFVVEGDPTIPAILPDDIKKKGIIWIV